MSETFTILSKPNPQVDGVVSTNMLLVMAASLFALFVIFTKGGKGR